MKRRIGILFLLLCMLSCLISVNPVMAESSDDGINETEETEIQEFSDDEDELVIPDNEFEDVIDEGKEPIDNEEESDDDGAEESVIEVETPEITGESFSFEIPEGFVVKESDSEGKELLKQENVLDSFNEMTEGLNYRENELVFLADSEQYAREVAEIYHCELKSFRNGVAVIRIIDEDISVRDIVKASFDPDLGLPLVEPNYVFKDKPKVPESNHEQKSENDVNGTMLPEVNDWHSWVNEVFEDPDPFLMTPAASNYQWHHEALNTFYGWNATMGDPGVKVAIIGQSVDPDHDELAGKVDSIDIGEGTDFFGDGSATHVAGIIAASVDNGMGGAGIAPNVSILSINVDDGSEEHEYSNIVGAIRAATDQKVDIITFTVGRYLFMYQEYLAIQQAVAKGTIVVAPAGDNNSNIQYFPAAYDNVIAVAATSRDGSRCFLSNYGPWITISAPGDSIVSTYSSEEYPDYYYVWYTGTQMAAGVVSGALALYMSKVGHLTYNDVIPVLKKSVTKSSSSQMGYGIISIEKMFDKLTTVPELKVYSSSGTRISDLSRPVGEGSYFEIENPHAGDSDTIIYTLDGKKPSIRNGEIVNGIVYDFDEIYLDQFEKGITLTVNAAVINSMGVMGTVRKFTIKTPAVTVQPLKIKTVSFDENKMTLNYSSEELNYFKINVKQLINVNSEEVDLDDVEHIWTSSNPDVAVVDEEGFVYAAGAGTAKITLKILDGSKKSASCTVTVNQLVESLEIKGQDSMAPGTSTTYSALAYPGNAKNKKVVWTISSSDPEITISSSGKVTVGKYVGSGEVFTVAATSTDGSEVYGSKTVEICQKATMLNVALNSTEDYSRSSFTKEGKLNSVDLFTVDLQDYGWNEEDEELYELHPLNDKQIQLDAIIYGNDIAPLWTSSNTKVATVDENGLVTAVGKGSAKITCTANDGSKLKSSVTVNVKVPISSLKIVTSNQTALRVGKSLNLKNRVAFGKQYGEPSVKKVNWSVSMVTYYDFENEETVDITDFVLSKKYVKITGNNKLTVTKDLAGLTNYGLTVYLRADSTDGTNYSDEFGIWISGDFSAMFFDDEYGTGWWVDEADEYVITFFSEWAIPFEITTSNPKVCGAYIDESSPREVTGEGDDYWWYQKNGKYTYYYHGWEYEIHLFAYPDKISDLKTGTVTLTMKALDGSGKTAKVKIKVKK